MLRTLRVLWQDERGFVLSAELVLILTVAVLMLVVGLHAVSKSVVTELNDVAGAYGVANQSYSYDGQHKPWHSVSAGSGFADRSDECDCSPIRQVHAVPKQDSGHGPES